MDLLLCSRRHFYSAATISSFVQDVDYAFPPRKIYQFTVLSLSIFAFLSFFYFFLFPFYNLLLLTYHPPFFTMCCTGMERTIPFYLGTIYPESIAQGKSVLIASSENAIRGLLMHLCEVRKGSVEGDMVKGERRRGM